MLITGITGAGRKPGQNEDAFLAGREVVANGTAEMTLLPPFFAAVADGVSGEDAGEVASVLALEVLSGIKPHPRTDFLSTALHIHKFLKMQGTMRGRPNMQTTLCAAAFLPDKTQGVCGSIVNIGDSRAYLFRDGALSQLTKDQSLARLLYETGQLTKREQESFAHKNVILPALGNLSADPAPEITPLPELRQGDVILLVTDGFSDFVKTPDAEYILALPEHLTKRMKKLYDRALMGGSKDNITVVAIAV
jgi:protein phosphatase